jgi:hypothetical protein
MCPELNRVLAVQLIARFHVFAKRLRATHWLHTTVETFHTPLMKIFSPLGLGEVILLHNLFRGGQCCFHLLAEEVKDILIINLKHQAVDA